MTKSKQKKLDSWKHNIELLLPGIVFFLCTIGLYVAVSIGGALLLTLYPLYLTFFFTGWGMIRYQARDLYHLSDSFILKQKNTETKVVIGLFVFTVVIHLSGFVALEFLIISYLMIGLIVFHLILLSKVIKIKNRS